MKSRHHRFSPTLFPKPGEKEPASSFFAAPKPLPWAERLKQAQAQTDIKKRLEALTNLVQEALGLDFDVQNKTALRSTNRNDCNYYDARGSDGLHVNFDANQLEESKTYYCKEEDGQFTTRIVLGMKALHPMGPAYTQMVNQQQQMLVKGMETRGWVEKTPSPTNIEKLQAYLANFTNFFFDLVSYNLQTCSPRIAFKFDGLFVAYKDVTKPEQVAAFETIETFYKTKIVGNTGNMIRFKIWLQSVLNDGVIIPNPLALKINQLPGLQLSKGDKPDKYICVK